MAEFVKIYCCGDCINYNWKKHKCNRGAHEEGKPTDHFYSDCPKGLHEESQWVLCSERLPEKVGLYLVTVEGYVIMERWNGESWWMTRPQAWMPLPDPWKGEQE